MVHAFRPRGFPTACPAASLCVVVLRANNVCPEFLARFPQIFIWPLFYEVVQLVVANMHFSAVSAPFLLHPFETWYPGSMHHVW